MINSLRLSITQRCNLNCPYCHREGQLSSERELSLQEIGEIIKSAGENGIKKIKITGGEPLLREDIVEIIKIIRGNGFKDISMVTNGLLLEKYAMQLKETGLNRVNIGCDSLSSSFLKNKGGIIDGLKAAKTAGLEPIKINMVVLKGINDNEINEMIEFAKEEKVIIQLIELINTNNEFYSKHYFSLEKIEKELGKKAVKITERGMHNRKQYNLGDVIVEVIRPFHNKFCQSCTRLRITSDGKLKPCLMRNDNLIDFRSKDDLLKAINLKEAQT